MKHRDGLYIRIDFENGEVRVLGPYSMKYKRTVAMENNAISNMINIKSPIRFMHQVKNSKYADVWKYDDGQPLRAVRSSIFGYLNDIRYSVAV